LPFINPDMLLLFLLQVCVVVAAAQAFGKLFQKLGQPRVVGEMFAGIALGPSLLGHLAPRLHQALFPEASLGLLAPWGNSAWSSTCSSLE
jgi:Kef-type K+ transport system membrane component KefB